MSNFIVFKILKVIESQEHNKNKLLASQLSRYIIIKTCRHKNIYWSYEKL